MARIAFLDFTFNWPPVGGCWVDLKEIADRLVAAGHQVQLFVPEFQQYYPRGKVDESLSFPVQKIPFNRFTYNIYQAGPRFKNAIAEFNPDVVYLGDGYFMKGAMLPYLKQWPLVLRFYAYELICFNLHYYLYDVQKNCDGNFFEDPDRCHKCWYTRKISFPKHALGIAIGVEDKHPALHFSQEYIGSLAFTEYYRKNLKHWLGIPKRIVVYNEFTRNLLSKYNSNVTMIPSGVDTNRFVPRPTDTASNAIPAIMMTGRVNDPLKGFQTVKEACDRLHSEGIKFQLLITAAYPVDFEAPYLKNLGWVDQEQLPGLYHKGDICLVPSIWMEPFGITTLESMAVGLPVVGSKTGGIEITLKDGETGLHFEPENVEALTDALRKLLINPELRKQMGAAARQRAVEVFDWGVIVKQYYLPMMEELVS